MFPVEYKGDRFHEIIILICTGIGNIDLVGRRRVIRQHKIDFPHIIPFVRTIPRSIGNRLRNEVHSEIDCFRTVGGIRRIGNQFFIKSIKAITPQHIGNTLPFLVQHISIEIRSFLQKRMRDILPLNKPGNRIV